MLILLLTMSALVWYFNREPPSLTLDYGKLMLILQDRDGAVRFKNVKVGRTEVRGEVVTNDEVSDGSLMPVRQTQTRSFRTPRIGVEGDTELFKRLRETVREGYQGEEEESALRGVYSLIMS